MHLNGENDDIIYLMNFPLDMFGFKVKNPPQDFISGGEKLNSLMQIVTFFMFVASGVVMWVPQYFPGWVIDWSYPMHNIALGLSFNGRHWTYLFIKLKIHLLRHHLKE